MTKPLIGVVGGIGSGKSLVARELAKLGGYLIVADRLGHEALEQSDIKGRVIDRFGKDIVDKAGNIDRRLLGGIVFADEKALRSLELLVFPYIGRRIREEIDKANRDSGVKFVVLDAAVMLEAGWGDECSHLVFVDAPRELRLARLRERGWSEQHILAREAMQMPLEEKRRRADAVLANDGAVDQVVEKAGLLLAQWNI